MRITHVVTLVSDGGAYGGPVSVATAQLTELAARGHTTLLLALWRAVDDDPPPARWDGVPLRARRARTLVPRTGFLGLLNLLEPYDIWRAAGHADVLHVHAGRDLVSLTALTVAALRRTPLVVQTHGMVAPRRGLVPWLFDQLYVPLLRRARVCLVLTEGERTALTEVLDARRTRRTRRTCDIRSSRGGPRLVLLGNGVPRSEPASGALELDGSPPTGPLPEPVRAPGSAPSPDSELRDVLFLARLHPVKRPEAFVEAAALVAAVRTGVRFTLYGADEGSLDAVDRCVERHGLARTVRYGGPLSHAAALRRIREAAVYVLPSSSEVFPMGLLEALAAGTPVVCTRGCGIAHELAARGAAFVTDGTPAALAGAVLGLLDDAPSARERTRALIGAGLRAVDELYSAAAVADRLEEVYRDA